MKVCGNNEQPRILWFCLSVVSLMFCVTTSRAQELIKNSTDGPTARPDPAIAERVKVLEGELERTNLKLDQLQKTIGAQQQTIEALLATISAARNDTASAAQRTTAGNPPGITAQAATNTQPLETGESAKTSDGTQAAQAPTVEQRLAKVEGDVLRVGPLRLSGDFRLRYDGTFRSASEPPDPPLAHTQNSRVRYRLRLNFDTDLYKTLSFHGQLATGPVNNPLTLDQDFTGVSTRHPLFISEAWIDYHPKKSIQLQAGRVVEIFADNSRFLFDDDLRLNGFNEKYVASLKENSLAVSSVEFRAGQYILTNPNVAIITPNSPLANAGAVVGTIGRSANLFHQGVLVNQTFNKKWSDQVGADIQLYRNPNQIQLASTTDGATLLVQPGLGIALSGPLPGTGNATTTPGGVIYTAPGFQVLRFTYRLNYAGFKHGDRVYPLTFNVQGARNVATGLNERDAMLATAQLGRVARKGDTSFLYVFSIKGANSLISQVTDDDLGTGSGVNIRTHHFRFDYGLARKVTLQSLFFFQTALRNSGQFPHFFVPLGAFAPSTYRLQEQIVFTF
ncbi:MAG TPA: putative porin [Pyrinomonadaceae bacterium]|nr:putative porin [Pyrinomonadaceae bacterium]